MSICILILRFLNLINLSNKGNVLNLHMKVEELVCPRVRLYVRLKLENGYFDLHQTSMLISRHKQEDRAWPKLTSIPGEGGRATQNLSKIRESLQDQSYLFGR
jgi:hypothetical protein